MVAWVGEEGDAPEYAAYGTTKGPVCECRRALSDRCRRRPTLPRPLGRSTIGAVGLNDRVRDGNGCGPYALAASASYFGCTIGQRRRMMIGARVQPRVVHRGRDRRRVERLGAASQLAVLDSGSLSIVVHGSN